MFSLFKKKYKHIFFDLDRTLWDFETNSHDTLVDMFFNFSLDKHFSNAENYVETFKKFNLLLWNEYLRGEIAKEMLRHQRFHRTLKSRGLDSHDLAEQLDNFYITECPKHTALMPHAIETLGYLKEKDYGLHIITNGFNEIQLIKIKDSGLSGYFDSITTSEIACSMKPHARIFEYAQYPLNTKKRKCLMVGDDWENDIVGAKKFGWDQVFYAPLKLNTGKSFRPTHEIFDLSELKEIL
ncbi:MAG: YjjG family noncanonical pyrimidine nucleotidase [Prevotellaceae bacterium]|jgi:putative hydrolase of the HAD superfamily|nr:YjjG family noncanonical pyrimidine nucleotidase [Prevotellaceae bacterium]